MSLGQAAHAQLIPAARCVDLCCPTVLGSQPQRDMHRANRYTSRGPSTPIELRMISSLRQPSKTRGGQQKTAQRPSLLAGPGAWTLHTAGNRVRVWGSWATIYGRRALFYIDCAAQYTTTTTLRNYSNVARCVGVGQEKRARSCEVGVRGARRAARGVVGRS